MKKCPFCAEQIQDEAIKCRWCGEMLTAERGAPSPQRPSREVGWVQQRSPADPTTFAGAIRSSLEQYASARGRASRREFWWYVLFVWLVLVLSAAIGESVAGLAVLALLVPNACAAIRRLHDVGHSGAKLLWALVPLFGGAYVLFLLASSGDPRPNRFGESPVGSRGDPSSSWASPRVPRELVLVLAALSALGGLLAWIGQSRPSEDRQPAAVATMAPPTPSQLCSVASGSWNICPPEGRSFETYVGLWRHPQEGGEDRLSIEDDGYVILATADLENVDPGQASLRGDRVLLDVYGYKKLTVRAIDDGSEIALLVTWGECTDRPDPTTCGWIFTLVDMEEVASTPWNPDIVVQPAEAFDARNYVGRWALYPIETSIDIDIGPGGNFRVTFNSGEAGEREFVGTWAMDDGFLRLDADGLAPSTVVVVSAPFLPGNPLELLFNTGDCGPLELQCGQVLESFGESQL